MPHDWPEVPELVRTAREFVEGVTGALEGRDRYHALCTAYLLEIAERELEQWAPLDTADDEALRALLDRPQHVPREALAEELCRDIREGRFDARFEELLAALIRHVRAKVEVSKPSFLDGAGEDRGTGR